MFGGTSLQLLKLANQLLEIVHELTKCFLDFATRLDAYAQVIKELFIALDAVDVGELAC